MIKQLSLHNVGPAREMLLDFGERLNIITGDNGLGKSFLLDIIWWTFTRRWPAEINPNLTAGKKALPTSTSPRIEATINYEIEGAAGKTISCESRFDRANQFWEGKLGRPIKPGLVLYAMADGSFAVWDPHRNYWRAKGNNEFQERPPAYVFSPTEVWDGLPGKENNWLCNGLIRDWSGWQKERGTSFKYLKGVLHSLSASLNETLEPGELTRISLDDVRDMPTIRMSYGQDVAVLHASAGMRRIMALAYFLVWAWREHEYAAKQLAEPPTRQITFLIDEIESHLHPSWQRRIVPAVLSVMGNLTKGKNLFSVTNVQLVTATHSPLVMASVEPTFDDKKDCWFDLDLEGREVVLRKRDFERHGDSVSWLQSEAFDLSSTMAIEYERLIDEASELLKKQKISSRDIEEIKKKNQELVDALDPRDPFLFRWRAICEKKGWFE